MALKPHQKIINRLARKHLRPMGIIQKGQSRIWLDDHGLFTIIIEFQPFSGRLGTCLNLGVNFHWKKQDYFSYDIGGRLFEFIYYKEDNQFESDLQELIETIKKNIFAYRLLLVNDPNLYNFTINYNFQNNEDTWSLFHKANAYALTGNIDKSIHYFKKILMYKADTPWRKNLEQKIQHEILKSLSSGVEAYKQFLIKIVIETREKKKLPAMDITL